MSVDKNRSEIVQSFKNLLKKADELAVEKNNNSLINKSKIGSLNINEKDRNIIDDLDSLKNFNRLGIKSIKRMPENRFSNKNKAKTKEYLIKEKELASKITNILNRHINYWLKKEMPRYAKNRLKEHVDNVLYNLKKNNSS